MLSLPPTGVPGPRAKDVNTTAFSITCYVSRNLRGFKKASCHCRFTLDAGAAFLLSGTAFFHRMLMKTPYSCPVFSISCPKLFKYMNVFNVSTVLFSFRT